ncbi:hypothetical protein HDU67_001803 [Dinochytrium kinnereticum]|nr:hypothetical protein HDU67_001803 [Dinochytrium kinnereticum]
MLAGDIDIDNFPTDPNYYSILKATGGSRNNEPTTPPSSSSSSTPVRIIAYHAQEQSPAQADISSAFDFTETSKFAVLKLSNLPKDVGESDIEDFFDPIPEFPSFFMALRALELKTEDLQYGGNIRIEWSSQENLRKTFYKGERDGDEFEKMHPFASQIVDFFMSGAYKDPCEFEIFEMNLMAFQMQLVTSKIIDFLATHENMLSFLTKVDPTHVAIGSRQSSLM